MSKKHPWDERLKEKRRPGYAADKFQWKDILSAMPPEKAPWASNIIHNPLDKKEHKP